MKEVTIDGVNISKNDEYRVTSEITGFNPSELGEIFIRVKEIYKTDNDKPIIVVESTGAGPDEIEYGGQEFASYVGNELVPDEYDPDMNHR